MSFAEHIYLLPWGTYLGVTELVCLAFIDTDELFSDVLGKFTPSSALTRITIAPQLSCMGF